MFTLQMRIQKKYCIIFGVTLILVAGMIGGMLGLEYFDEQELAAFDNQPNTQPPGKVSLVIKVPQRVLEVYNEGEFYKKYRIAVGKGETPTPIGEWNIVWKDYNWGTGFGSRWMGLNVPWGTYGIHGTNKPWSIGRYASHGCIRMRNRDVEEIFDWVPIGTLVKIEGSTPKIKRILKYQTAGQDVAIMQLKLKELGYLSSRSDGIFGTVTEQAVKQFQVDKGLEPTGIVDKEILKLLGI